MHTLLHDDHDSTVQFYYDSESDYFCDYINSEVFHNIMRITLI